MLQVKTVREGRRILGWGVAGCGGVSFCWSLIRGGGGSNINDAFNIYIKPIFLLDAFQ